MRILKYRGEDVEKVQISERAALIEMKPSKRVVEAIAGSCVLVRIRFERVEHSVRPFKPSTNCALWALK